MPMLKSNTNKSSQHRSIAITPGEPAGIGPDIILSLLEHDRVHTPITVIADQNMLQQRAEQLCYKKALNNPNLSIHSIPCAKPVTPGVLNRDNANY